MMKEGHGPTKELQDLNWGAFDHASHAPQLRSCNYYIYQLIKLITCVAAIAL